MRDKYIKGHLPTGLEKDRSLVIPQRLARAVAGQQTPEEEHATLIASQLTPRERRLISSERLGISDIVLWEIARLYQKGRIAVSLADPDFLEALAEVHVWLITRELCLKLPELDFSSDPADELIAATSLLHNVPLLTRDVRMRKSRKVPLV